MFTLTSPPEKKRRTMLDQFQRWIITLGAQVRALYGSISYRDVEQLRRDMATCEAELQQLYIYAKQRDIKLINYYHPFAEIEAYLLLIHKRLGEQ
jgi:hypothetical protein